jgi:hypothetical protein
MLAGGMPRPSSENTMRTESDRGSLTRIASRPACPVLIGVGDGVGQEVGENLTKRARIGIHLNA